VLREVLKVLKAGMQHADSFLRLGGPGHGGQFQLAVVIDTRRKADLRKKKRNSRLEKHFGSLVNM